jgi:hypothetical protein
VAALANCSWLFPALWRDCLDADALTGIGTLALTLWSYRAMRRAEAAVAKMEQDR